MERYNKKLKDAARGRPSGKQKKEPKVESTGILRLAGLTGKLAARDGSRLTCLWTWVQVNMCQGAPFLSTQATAAVGR